MNEVTFNTQAEDQSDLVSKALNLVDQAGRAVVTTHQEMEKAGDLVKILKTMKKKAEDKRKDLVKPINDTVKKINAEFKITTDPIDKAIKTVTGLMTVFATEQERLAQVERQKVIDEAEEKAIADAEAAHQVATTAREAGDEKVAEKAEQEAKDIVDQAATDTNITKHTGGNYKAHGDYGATVGTRKTRRWKAENLAMVPPEFLLLDDAAVKAAVFFHKKKVEEYGYKQGRRGKALDAYVATEMEKFSINGIEFYFETGVSVR